MLNPQNNIRRAAEKCLETFFENAACVPAMMQQIMSGPDARARQVHVHILRRGDRPPFRHIQRCVALVSNCPLKYKDGSRVAPKATVRWAEWIDAPLGGGERLAR